MRTRHFFTSFSIGAALTACTPRTEPEPEPEPPALAGSFEVTATLAYPPGTPTYGVPTSERLVLRLDDAPSGSVTAVWGASDGSASGTFERTDTGISLRAPVQLGVVTTEPDTWEASVRFEALALSLSDRDEDGEVDGVEGTGSGTFSHVLGDVQFDYQFTATLGGTPDDTPPELVIQGNPDALDVLDRLRIVASEPLHPDTKAVIRYGDTRVVMEQSPGDGTHVRSFTTGVLLPFGAELGIEFDPAPADLAGLVSENAPTTARTMAGPGIFAEDGFEGDLAAVLGGAQVVTGVGTLPAIAGTRSLLVEPEDTLTMRLPLIAGETHLRFQVRVLFDENGSAGCSRLAFRAGFPGLDPASDTYDIYIPRAEGPEEATGDARWVRASPVVGVELALPAGAAGEVIFDAYQKPAMPGLPCPNQAFLIDDLRTE
jgi:hypothetical protein